MIRNLSLKTLMIKLITGRYDMVRSINKALAAIVLIFCIGALSSPLFAGQAAGAQTVFQSPEAARYPNAEARLSRFIHVSYPVDTGIMLKNKPLKAAYFQPPILALSRYTAISAAYENSNERISSLISKPALKGVSRLAKTIYRGGWKKKFA